MDALKKYFTQSHFTSMEEVLQKQKDGEVDQAIMLSNIFIVILMVTIFLMGFVAVSHLCPEQSDRGKNTRLGLYFLLLITGGQIGWIYILLWVANINICA